MRHSLLGRERSLKNIWVPVSGAVAQQQKIDTIANNVANANTTGFKKDEVVFKEYLTAIDKGVEDIHIPRKTWSPKDFYYTQGAQNSHVKTDGTFTQHTQGPLEPTGNAFDMAIQGEGFFEVLSPQGIRYTRNGSFNIASQGLLVTKDGYPVLKAQDNPEQDVRERFIQVPPNQRVNINFEGELSSNNLPIAQLSLAQFNDAHA